MTDKLIPAFASGEIAPSVTSRLDVSKHALALKRCRNFKIERHGGASNRDGFQWIGRKARGLSGGNVVYKSDNVNLIPFQFNNEQTYMLEFGDLYFRVIKNGAYVTLAANTITGATQANPVVITDVGHGYTSGDEILLTDVGGMVELNGGFYVVNVLTPNTYELVGIDGTGYTAFTTGGSSKKIYEVTTTYADADVMDLYYDQSADIITITHESYPVREVARTSDTSWTITNVTFGPTLSAPTGLGVTPSGAGTSKDYGWNVTAVDTETGAESLVASVTNTSGPDIYGAASRYYTLNWTGSAGANRYNIYRSDDNNGVYGFVGSTTSTTYLDRDTLPDMSDPPPEARTLFNTTDAYPKISALHQQRKYYARSNDYIENVWASRSGEYKNFNGAFPLRASDPITFATVASEGQVHEVRHLVSLVTLLVLTAGGEWAVTGGGLNDPLTPLNIDSNAHGYRGASTVRPAVSGKSVLFLSSNNKTVRNLGYSEADRSYVGSDLTVLANHLFDGYTITSMAYSDSPDSILWAVRDDGRLLAMTYIPEQDIWAWSLHETEGEVTCVSSVRENNYDAVYIAVKRFIGDSEEHFIERLHERDFKENVRKAFFVDSGLSYSDTVSATTVAKGTYGGSTEAVYLKTSAAHGLTNGDTVILMDFTRLYGIDGKTFQIESKASDEIWLLSADEGEIVTWASFSADYFGSEDPLRTRYLPDSFTVTGDIYRPFTTIRGLWHLEGRSVVGLANGGYFDGKTVTNGAISFDEDIHIIHVGLAYTSYIQLMDADIAATSHGKLKSVADVTISQYLTRGLEAGPSLSRMNEVSERSDERYGSPIELITAKQEITCAPDWSDTGDIYIRQKYPIPATILAVNQSVQTENG